MTLIDRHCRDEWQQRLHCAKRCLYYGSLPMGTDLSLSLNHLLVSAPRYSPAWHFRDISERGFRYARGSLPSLLERLFDVETHSLYHSYIQRQ